MHVETHIGREEWVVAGQPSREVAQHLAWDLLFLPPPQVRVAPVKDVVVVLPRSRNPRQEVYLDRCIAEGVPVVYRPSGGGAVVLAPGMVTLSALAPLSGGRGVERLFTRFCGLLVRGLAACGVVGLSLQGVSDLCLGNRKVVGTSLRILGKAALFQASVLVNCSLEIVERYLPYPSRAPAYRARRHHLEFLTTLAREGYLLTPLSVAGSLSGVFSRALVTEEGNG